MRISIWALCLFGSLSQACGARAALTSSETQLAKSIGFDAAVLQRIKSAGESYERLIGQTYEDEEVPANAVVLLTASGKGHERLSQVRAALRGTSYAASLYENAFGAGRDKIAVMRGSDDLAYLETVYVSAPNYQITHEQVMQRYRQWRLSLGLELLGANQDWLSARITKPPADWKKFAAEVYEFCPDIVDQGTLTVDKLADEMRTSGELFLWWD